LILLGPHSRSVQRSSTAPRTRRLALLALVSLLVLALPAVAATPKTSQVDVSSSGAKGNQGAAYFSVSATGRYTAFDSESTNLVAGDGNGADDVFVRDRRTHATKRVSLSSSGAQANDDAFDPAISGGGRYVAFFAAATNLVAHDTNGVADIFVRDREQRRTIRANVSSAGVQANGFSSSPSISADGRAVVFSSLASSLVPHDTNGLEDIFLRNTRTHKTSRVSVSSTGAQANGESTVTDNTTAVSQNGRYVVFQSLASNLVSSDSNGAEDIFIRDRKARTTRRLSVGPANTQANAPSYNAVVSASGRFVIFTSEASNLILGDGNGTSDIFVRDRKLHTTRRVSVGTGGTEANSSSSDSGISSNGRWVAFASFATNLVLGDTNLQADIFWRDRKTGVTKLVSVGPAGVQGDDQSFSPALSADGRFAGFDSLATNLVPGDLNGTEDVFLRGPLH
jgi:Tol biopolymer transport system component